MEKKVYLEKNSQN